MKTVTISTARPYEVVIGRGLLARTGALLAEKLEPCTAVLVADGSVDALYGDAAAASLSEAGFRVLRWCLPPGEDSKSLAFLGHLLEFLAEHGVTRSDLIIALGGGVTGDLAGFAAAVYLRGIRYTQLPTTLLAAVDSSVGGKTAVNLRAGKNLAGAFCQPEAVLCDCDTLKTLPEEVYSAGAAEAVKCGMLADAALFRRLGESGARREVEEIIARCVGIKGEIVAADERELGLRQLLNFGHTAGHALERCSGYRMSHGHAVAVGMLIASRAAEKMGFCEAPCAAPLAAVLAACNLPLHCPYPAEALAEAAMSDKKRRGGEITLVVPARVGACRLQKLPVEKLTAFFRAGLEGQV
jgi:3-dehydroquinate synthase